MYQICIRNDQLFSGIYCRDEFIRQFSKKNLHVRNKYRTLATEYFTQLDNVSVAEYKFMDPCRIEKSTGRSGLGKQKSGKENVGAAEEDREEIRRDLLTQLLEYNLRGDK